MSFLRLRLSIALVLVSFFSFDANDLHGQISTKIKFLVSADTERSHESIISITWDSSEEYAWREANEGRLDIPGFKLALSSEKFKTSDSSGSTFIFKFPMNGDIELLISDIQLAPEERIYLLDKASGNVFFEIKGNDGDRRLTPAFDPKTVVFAWECKDEGDYNSSFSIDNIYFRYRSDSSRGGIGFNTALPCHPNAACKEDSVLQVIAESAVRMRMVMEEGIGWCTGSFINTTRNDKTPYLLSAYHCQYDYTPLYDMWRFDFNYHSDTCENPDDEPAFTSLTGCSLISSGQASDFLLVLLDDPIPANQQATFAGWDRDVNAKPDTSYLIHHPNADIRKISTCVNEATIHPNEIGWVEGYSTPGFHHFRMKFTEGGHQPGSSGGPLFNENGYLVGQLHGGTSGCESINNTYIGRLSKSWDLGSTAQERLGDWLDPDQTGLTKIESLPNIASSELMTIRGYVKDPHGAPVSNAVLTVSGSFEDQITTGDEGYFEIPDVHRNGTYTLSVEKLDNPANGLNALDLIAIQKHLLGKDTLDHSWQYIAADATNNVDLSVGDIVLILRLLLGKIQIFPSSPSWRFDPPEMQIDAEFPGDPEHLEITGIKIGDVNGTADPNH